MAELDEMLGREAATGEIVSAEELGGAEMHTQISGVGDYLAQNDADGVRRICQLRGRVKAGPRRSASPIAAGAPSELP